MEALISMPVIFLLLVPDEPIPLFFVLAHEDLFSLLRHRSAPPFVFPGLDHVLDLEYFLLGEMIFKIFSVAGVPVQDQQQHVEGLLPDLGLRTVQIGADGLEHLVECGWVAGLHVVVHPVLKQADDFVQLYPVHLLVLGAVLLVGLQRLPGDLKVQFLEDGPELPPVGHVLTGELSHKGAWHQRQVDYVADTGAADYPFEHKQQVVVLPFTELHDHLENDVDILLQLLVVPLEHLAKVGNGEVPGCGHIWVEDVLEHIGLVDPEELAIDKGHMLILDLDPNPVHLLLPLLDVPLHHFLLVLEPQSLEVLQELIVHEREDLIKFLNFEVEEFVEELLGILLQLDVLGADGDLNEHLKDELDDPDTCIRACVLVLFCSRVGYSSRMAQMARMALMRLSTDSFSSPSQYSFSSTMLALLVLSITSTIRSLAFLRSSASSSPAMRITPTLTPFQDSSASVLSSSPSECRYISIAASLTCLSAPENRHDSMWKYRLMSGITIALCFTMEPYSSASSSLSGISINVYTSTFMFIFDLISKYSSELLGNSKIICLLPMPI